jgi:hypothetical protein
MNSSNAAANETAATARRENRHPTPRPEPWLSKAGQRLRYITQSSMWCIAFAITPA